MTEENNCRGTVETVNKDSLTVVFQRSEACRSCAAQSLCHGGGKTCRAEIKTAHPENFEPGRPVELVIDGKTAALAVFLAYGLPLVLALVALFGVLAAGGSQTVAAWACLLTPAVCYLLLALCRRRIAAKIKISVR